LCDNLEIAPTTITYQPIGNEFSSELEKYQQAERKHKSVQVHIPFVSVVGKNLF
jgi:hypothetical protein